MNIYKLILGFLVVALLPNLSLAATPQAASDSYRLAPIDKIEVNIFRQPNMQTTQRIDGRGNISLPLLGSVQVGGLSISEAERKIARSYVENRFLRDPSVSVAVLDYAPKTVTVMGQVEEPGDIELPMEANSVAISKAIAMAGGFTGTAKKSDVKVIRENGSGNETTYRVDVDEEIESGSTRFRARPGDTIVVPRRIF